MVAINALSLLTVLPALALAASIPGHQGAHVVRHGAHGRHHGVAARAAVGTGAQRRQRARGHPQCRPRPTDTDNAPATETTAVATSTPAPESTEAPPAEDNTEHQAPPAEESASPAQESAPPAQESAPPAQEWTPPAEEHAPPAQETAPPAEETAPPAQEEQKGPQNLSNAWAHHDGGNAGLLYAAGPCGDNQPDAANPNGQQWWFNCGIDEGGWNPPFLTMDQVKYVDYQTNAFFEPCKDYFHIFQAASAQYNVPATFIAAIAMQESTCRPWLTGGAGEQGMMQLVGINCDGAPNGDCKDVWFNIHSGTRYLREMTNQHGGSLLLGLGAYNGWQKGMTRQDVRVKANEWGCYAQQNLDYMQEFLNGWLQGKEGWKLGTIKNRLECE